MSTINSPVFRHSAMLNANHHSTKVTCYTTRICHIIKQVLFERSKMTKYSRRDGNFQCNERGLIMYVCTNDLSITFRLFRYRTSSALFYFATNFLFGTLFPTSFKCYLLIFSTCLCLRIHCRLFAFMHCLPKQTRANFSVSVSFNTWTCCKGLSQIAIRNKLIHVQLFSHIPAIFRKTRKPS